MNPPVNYHFFMHVPKTAGTSMRELLESHFDPQRCIPTLEDMRNLWGGVYPAIPDLLSLPDATWHSAQLLRGHYYYQIADRFPRAPICLTLLREPVARSLSTVRHIIRTAPRYQECVPSDLVFDEGFMARNVANMQVKMLGVRFDLNDPKQWPRDTNGLVRLNENHLQRAISTLSKFEFVGLQERFEESMALLCRLFGWRQPERLPRSNVGEDRHLDQLDAACIEKVRSYNNLDLELYDSACQLFDQRLSEASLSV